MGKKKKRTKKRPATAGERYDFHHFLYYRKIWTSERWARELREHPYCGVFLPQLSLHRSIHQAITCVPLSKHPDKVLRRLNDALSVGVFSVDDKPEIRAENLSWLFGQVGDYATAKALAEQAVLIADFWAGR